MKRSQLLIATIALPLDYLMLVLSGVLAYQLRFVPVVRGLRPVVFQLPLSDFIPLLLVVALVWIGLFALAGLYVINSYVKFSQEVGKLFLACSAGLALIIVLFFFNPLLFSSRFIVLVGSLLAFLLTMLERLALRLFRASLYRRGLATTRVALVGSDAATLALEQLFHNSPGLGFRVVGRLKLEDLTELMEGSLEVDEVIVGEALLPRETSSRLLEYCTTHHLGFKYVADMFEAQSHNVVVHTLAGLPIVEIKRTPLDGWGRVAKRIFDLVASLLLMVFLSPVMLLTAVAIVLDSGWPVLWSRFDDGAPVLRVGEHGRPFHYFKFRSMKPGTHSLRYTELSPQDTRSDGPLVKIKNDPRVTRVGRFIRHYSIDELPELWLVFTGKMSLVGPRPHLPEEVAKYSERQRRVLTIKPGVTGLSQISGRDNLSFADEVRLDTFYIENWSLGSDLVILIKTAVVVWQRQAANV